MILIAIMDFKQWSLCLRFMQYINFWLKLCNDGQIILWASYNLNAKCKSQIKMLPDPIIAAIKKTSKMIDKDSSYLKIYTDYCISMLGQASLSFLYLA